MSEGVSNGVSEGESEGESEGVIEGVIKGVSNGVSAQQAKQGIFCTMLYITKDNHFIIFFKIMILTVIQYRTGVKSESDQQLKLPVCGQAASSLQAPPAFLTTGNLHSSALVR